MEETGIVFSEEPAAEDYFMMLEHSIEQVTSGENNVIFDRCPVDLLAYVQVVNNSEDINIQSLYNRVKDAMSEIDLLVFVPVEKPDLIGCPQSEMPELRLKVNDILRDWIRDFNTNSIEVTGSPASRRDQVLKQMSKI